MKVYLTKTWGFSSPSGPLQFSTAGWRTTARRLLEPGDLVAIVGTKGPETDEAERGKVLGVMEPTRHLVSSLDYDLVRGPQDFDASGRYKWPFGLELARAWRIDDPRPLLSDISPRRFQMDSAQGIVLLDDADARAILALPRTEVGLLSSVAARARVEGADIARRKATPPPTTQRRGIMHMRKAPAFAYAMEIVGAAKPAVKIGWTFNWIQRERQFNHKAMPALGGLRYKTRLHHLFGTAREAFGMEQALLRRFDALRHGDNIEILTPVGMAEVDRAWADYLVSLR
ncbi:MAG TPA: hypothetical protein VFQ67_08195 [Allosphingosinicella sp.]|jgi:hypothetical protein|nr:hypothetical protein [Allosphingosinicella sp.]